MDPQTGRSYWYNRQYGVSRWTDPKEEIESAFSGFINFMFKYFDGNVIDSCMNYSVFAILVSKLSLTQSMK